MKPPTCGKPFARRNSEPFMNSLSRTSSMEKSLESLSSDLSSYCDLCHDLNETVSVFLFLFLLFWGGGCHCSMTPRILYVFLSAGFISFLKYASP